MENLVGIGWEKNKNILNRNPYDLSFLEELLHKALISGGLGNIDKKAPLKDIIKPGSSVLLKPNWVFHYNQSNKGIESLVTHSNFIEVVFKEVLRCNPGKVIIGDAPIQGCNFDKLIKKEWVDKLRSYSPVEFEIKDFRRTAIHNEHGDLSHGVEENRFARSNYILFDMGSDSVLEPISKTKGQFRVTMYDPRKLDETHRSGKHQYLLEKTPFEVDVILNLPKLKTHQKAGITGSLKNLVGINGNKDYLPHHRIGGSKSKGDCYKGNPLDKKIIEILIDNANKRINQPSYKYFAIPAKYLLYIRKIFGFNSEITGGWYGNDTIWRTVLDLNSLLLYGTRDGIIHKTQQRKVYIITDAVIAGERNGPLNVDPVSLGVITYGESSAFVDLVNTFLMRFDWKKIPMIREAFNDLPLPLALRPPDDCIVNVNGCPTELNKLSYEIGHKFVPAPGWIDHIEKTT